VNQISTIPFLSSIGEIIINLFLFLILLLIVSNKRNQQNSKINTAAGLFSFNTIAVIALASINVFLYNLGAENVFGIEPKILLNLYANWPRVCPTRSIWSIEPTKHIKQSDGHRRHVGWTDTYWNSDPIL